LSVEPFLTAKEVAERLGLQPSTVVDYFETGDLPGFRLRGRKGAPLRFRWSEIEAAIEGWRQADAPGREVSPTRTGNARHDVFLLSSPTAPPEAAEDEKKED
jgi:excisionase family DNA binding protein